MADSFWPSVQLLLPFDSDNSDISSFARTPTNHSSTINATNFKFDGGALDTTTAGSYVSYAPSIAIGTQPFTVECWARITGTWPGGSSAYPLVAQWDTAFNFLFCFDNNGGSGFSFYTAGTFTRHVSGVNPADNNFHHYCAERDGSNTLRLYIDGVVKGTFTNFTTNIPATDVLTVGHEGPSGGGSSWPGQIDEVRVTVGAVRYGGAFTPASAAFSTGGLAGLPTPPPISRYLNILAAEVDPDLDAPHPLSLFRQRSAITIQPTSTSHARASAALIEYVATNPATPAAASATLIEYVATNPSPPAAASRMLVEYVALVLKPTAPPPMLRVRLAWDEFTDQDDPPRRSPFQRLSPAPAPPPSPQLPAGPSAMLRYRQSWSDEDEPARMRPSSAALVASVPATLPTQPRMLRVRMGWEDEDDALRPPRMRRFTPPRIVSTMVDYAVCVIT